MLTGLKGSEKKTFIILQLQNRAHVCRLCFEALDTCNFSVFLKDIENKLQFCFPGLLLNKDPELPQLICAKCHDLLQNVYTFVQNIFSTEDIFEEYLNKYDKYNFEKISENEEINKEETPVSSDIDDNEICKSNVKKPAKRKLRGKYDSTTNSNNYYSCSYCSKKYRSNYELQVHLRTHSGEKPFSCKVCYKFFIDIRNLRRHEKIHVGKKDHQCPVCHKSFLHLFSLKTHRRTHTGEKQFVCENCGKPFNTSGQLRVHFRTHTRERPYCCSICNKAFSSKAGLNIHMKIHTHEKTHGCLVCAQKCRTAYDLKVHVRCHNNERPYMCKYANCNKQYKSSSQLNVHLRTHLGDKQHQCQICQKRFGESNTLKRHMLTHEEKRKKGKIKSAINT